MTNRTLKDPIGSTSSDFESSLRQRRYKRIRAFTETNRYTRDWINFAEIAEWCSEEDGILPNQKKRAAAYDSLARDLLAGEFVEGGRSRVRYLHPRSAKVRMTAAWLQDAITHNYGGDHGRGFLANCWIPRSMFSRWLAKHRHPASPPRFEPVLRSEALQLMKPRRGRPAEYNWAGVKLRLLDYVSQHGPVRIFAELLQKCSDFASELHPKRRTPDDKTIRVAIRKHELDVAAGFSVPGN